LDVGEKLTILWGVWVQIVRLPCRREGIIGVWMPFTVLGNGFLELLFPNITPRADSITNDFDIELRHLAQGRSQHAPEETIGKYTERKKRRRGM
jgi:hypothetical protein